MYFPYIFVSLTFLLICNINPIQGNGQILTSIQNNAFYVDTEQKYTWFESLIACAERNMTLVTIDSRTKYDEIKSVIDNNDTIDYLWIGGVMSRVPERHYVWLDTGKPFTFAVWQEDNPDFFENNEYCIHLNLDMEFNDLYCDDPLGFMCEYGRTYQQNRQLKQKLDEVKTTI